MSITGKKIAIFVAPLFDDSEFIYSYYRMLEAGAEVIVAGLQKETYEGKKGLKFLATESIEDLKAENIDGIIIPGGFAPDYLRREPAVIDFVRRIIEQKKPVAAICHGPSVLISSGILRNKKTTSFHSIKDDMINAGAYWIDQDVVIDDNLVTSRSPEDLPFFCKAYIELFEDKD